MLQVASGRFRFHLSIKFRQLTTIDNNWTLETPRSELTSYRVLSGQLDWNSSDLARTYPILSFLRTVLLVHSIWQIWKIWNWTHHFELSHMVTVQQMFVRTAQSLTCSASSWLGLLCGCLASSRPSNFAFLRRLFTVQDLFIESRYFEMLPIGPNISCRLFNLLIFSVLKLVLQSTCPKNIREHCQYDLPFQTGHNSNNNKKNNDNQTGIMLQPKEQYVYIYIYPNMRAPKCHFLVYHLFLVRPITNCLDKWTFSWSFIVPNIEHKDLLASKGKLQKTVWTISMLKNTFQIVHCKALNPFKQVQAAFLHIPTDKQVSIA